ncbi:MAG: ABC transporter substrate-binding protein [Thermoleophilia bacterium]|nr:ABC transporter substrate-binding protein [Thermoleophilia bacterium]
MRGRWLAVALILTLAAGLLALAGCGGDDGAAPPPATEDATTPETEAPETEAPETAAPETEAPSSPDPGITDDSVKLGVTGPLSGRNAAFAAMHAGAQLYFDSVNAAGGIAMADGKTRTVEILLEDDAQEPQRSFENVRKLVEQDQVFAIFNAQGTANVQAFAGYLEEKGVPDLFPFTAGQEWGNGELHPLTVALMPAFTSEAAIVYDYLSQNMPDAKIALLYLDTDFGLEWKAALEGLIAGTGMELVAAESHNIADPTIDSQFSKLRASNADVFIIATVGGGPVQTLQLLKTSDWAPQVYLTFASSSPVTNIIPAGEGAGVGLLTATWRKPLGLVDDPGVQAYLEAFDEFQPGYEREDALGFWGWCNAAAAAEALKRMVEPTREALVSAALSLDQVPLDCHLPGIPLDTSESDRYAIESWQLLRWTGGGYEPVGEPITSFEGGKTPQVES